MNLVDSSGWLEYLGGGPLARSFAAPLEDVGQLLVPTICITEVCKVLLRDRGKDAALETRAAMERGTVVDLDADLAFRAAFIAVEHRLPYADSIILATAQAHEALLWTSDKHFSAIPGVRYVPKR